MQTHRRMPARKTEGTVYNLHPATRPAGVVRVQVGDVVVIEPGHPAVITYVRRLNTEVVLRGRYIWQAVHETPWPLGRFPNAVRIDRAIPGEYPKPRPSTAH